MTLENTTETTETETTNHHSSKKQKINELQYFNNTTIGHS